MPVDFFKGQISENKYGPFYVKQFQFIVAS